MLRIDRLRDGGGVRLVLSGRIEREGLAQLQRALDGEVFAPGAITIDTEEVRLLDREAVRFLVRCAAAGIRIVNAPTYIREWMSREQKVVADDPDDSTSPKD
jgi:hypothetical protein